MGLGVERVKRVFSKDRSRSSLGDHQSKERYHGAERSKWGLARFKMCGDDFDSVRAEDDSDAAGFSEATVSQPVAEASEATITQSVDEDPQNEQVAKTREDEQAWEGEEISLPKLFGEAEAAVIIQSAFRGFQARRQYKEMQQITASDGESRRGHMSRPSICTSTEVQLGDSAEDSGVQAEHSTAQQQVQQKFRSQMSRPSKEWDGSTVSSNISKLRIQNRLDAMTRRERALAYAFSQQLRTCSTKKKAAQNGSDEPNPGWSWLERWMATRAPDNSLMRKCMSRPIYSKQTYLVFKKKADVSVEEMESCGSNDVSVCFENVVIPSKGTGVIHRPVKNRLKATRSGSRRKTVPSCHFMMQPANVKAIKKDSFTDAKKETLEDAGSCEGLSSKEVIL